MTSTNPMDEDITFLKIPSLSIQIREAGSKVICVPAKEKPIIEHDEDNSVVFFSRELKVGEAVTFMVTDLDRSRQRYNYGLKVGMCTCTRKDVENEDFFNHKYTHCNTNKRCQGSSVWKNLFLTHKGQQFVIERPKHDHIVILIKDSKIRISDYRRYFQERTPYLFLCLDGAVTGLEIQDCDSTCIINQRFGKMGLENGQPESVKGYQGKNGQEFSNKHSFYKGDVGPVQQIMEQKRMIPPQELTPREMSPQEMTPQPRASPYRRYSPQSQENQTAIVITPEVRDKFTPKKQFKFMDLPYKNFSLGSNERYARRINVNNNEHHAIYFDQFLEMGDVILMTVADVDPHKFQGFRVCISNCSAKDIKEMPFHVKEMCSPNICGNKTEWVGLNTVIRKGDQVLLRRSEDRSCEVWLNGHLQRKSLLYSFRTARRPYGAFILLDSNVSALEVVDVSDKEAVKAYLDKMFIQEQGLW